MQTSHGYNPPIGRAGQLADARTTKHIVSRLADGAVAAGLAVARGDAPDVETGHPGAVGALAASPAIGADVDAIVTTHATAASDQTLSGADLNGAAGGAVMTPSRKITLVMNSHANWDATTAYIRGLDSSGRWQEEALTIPDGGNATVTTTKGFARVTEVFVPTQSGTAGSYTVGIAAGGVDLGSLQLAGVALYDAAREPNTSAAEYADEDTVSVVQSGAVYVTTEDACVESDVPYCRITATGSEEAGAWRNDSDSGDAFPVRGARFCLSSDAAGLNVLEFSF